MLSVQEVCSRQFLFAGRSARVPPRGTPRLCRAARARRSTQEDDAAMVQKRDRQTLRVRARSEPRSKRDHARVGGVGDPRRREKRCTRGGGVEARVGCVQGSPRSVQASEREDPYVPGHVDDEDTREAVGWLWGPLEQMGHTL